MFKYFNSHPHEEDDHVARTLVIRGQYFNSHPHEEDDGRKGDETQWRHISTHILTKRMTEKVWLTPMWFNISTHILTKRMTFLEWRYRD